MFLNIYRYIKIMVIKSEIIYPFFLECCQYTPDLYWKNVFDDLAYGKTPQGTYIHKNHLNCNKKGKEFSYKIEHDMIDLFQLYSDIYDLLKNKVGLMSTNDDIKNQENFNNIETRMCDKKALTWGEIRKKSTKARLLEKFAINMKRIHGLTTEESRNLNNTITIATNMKTISNDDIEFFDGEISSIRGITVDDGKVCVAKTIYDSRNDSPPAIVNEQLYMSDMWTKYIKGRKL